MRDWEIIRAMIEGFQNISILFNHPVEGSGPDDLDTLDQVHAVRKALEDLGHDVLELSGDDDLKTFKAILEEHQDRLIFNLTDPLSGEGRFISLYPLILEQKGFSYTGCSADALYLNSNKLISKRLMVLGGIPTPYWISKNRGKNGGKAGIYRGNFSPGRYILKSIWEHGSAGLTGDSIISVGTEAELEERLDNSPAGVFAEKFLPGREVNIALLSGKEGGWDILPPSEIIYSNSSEQSPFLDYRSKWEEDSTSYNDSARSLEFPPEDADFIKKLSRIALECADVFHLNGYARVDFRMDEDGEPFVMEVNANPCLSPGGGFASVVEKAGIAYKEMILRIISSSISA